MKNQSLKYLLKILKVYTMLQIVELYVQKENIIPINSVVQTFKNLAYQVLTLWRMETGI